ncbi:WD40-repeat-containing domain protein [Abortiporus biennis]|nr:WD40-repeat-containing domain protein [Abortiporus biennis]
MSRKGKEKQRKLITSEEVIDIDALPEEETVADIQFVYAKVWVKYEKRPRFADNSAEQPYLIDNSDDDNDIPSASSSRGSSAPSTSLSRGSTIQPIVTSSRKRDSTAPPNPSITHESTVARKYHTKSSKFSNSSLHSSESRSAVVSKPNPTVILDSDDATMHIDDEDHELEPYVDSEEEPSAHVSASPHPGFELPAYEESDGDEPLHLPDHREDVFPDIENIEAEEDYATLHSAYDVDIDQNWSVPIRKRSSACEVAKLNTFDVDALSITETASHSLKIGLKGKMSGTQMFANDACRNPLNTSERYRGRNFIWTNLSWMRQMKPDLLQQYSNRTSIGVSYPHLMRLKVDTESSTTSLNTSGPVNMISQSGKKFAVASNTPGGMSDFSQSSSLRSFLDLTQFRQPLGVDDPNLVDPYNKDGALIMYCDQKACFLNDHMRPANSDLYDERERYYTVNDVQFDPLNPNRLVSSGQDCRVRFWGCDTVDGRLTTTVISTDTYNCVPFDIVFKPNTSILAIEGLDGSVHLQRGMKRRTTLQPALIPRKACDDMNIRMLWGGASSTLLFTLASSEACNVTSYKVYDIKKQAEVMKVGTKDFGHTMAYYEPGSQLALALNNASHEVSIHLYDIRQKTARPGQSVKLSPSDSDKNLDINDMSYSPDGIYLALARTDNCVQLYDSRYLRKGCHILDLQHQTPSNKDHFGVVKIEWVQAAMGSYGIVTGGADGHVLLWDIARTTGYHDCETLVRTNCDIAYFSLGDIYKDEKPLIIGGGDGTITTCSV